MGVWGMTTPRIHCSMLCKGWAVAVARDQVRPFYACEEHRTERHEPLVVDPPPVCEQCGTTENVTWMPAATAYHTPTVNELPHSIWKQILINMGVVFLEEDGEYVNCPSAYCPTCAEEYSAHWDEMWRDYYSGLL